METASTLAAGPFPALIPPRQLAWRPEQQRPSPRYLKTRESKVRDLVRRCAERIGLRGVRSDTVPANLSAVLLTWLNDALSGGIPAIETLAGEGRMRGSDERGESLFSYVSCEARVPADHPLRPIPYNLIRLPQLLAA